MLVDSHCHLDLIETGEQGMCAETAVNSALSADVSTLLTVSTSLHTFPTVYEFSQQFPNVYASVGVHPHNDDHETVTFEALKALAEKPKVVAIGETGLDYYYTHDVAERQQANFRVHIAVAKAVNKPLIIHTRAAQADTLTIMRDEKASECGGVMHCFTESWEMAKAALDLGFYISISGIVTFKNADSVREVARQVPADRLLVETDSPYLAPVPYRGQRNQPAYVKEVAQYLAELRGVPFETLAEQTTENFFNLFCGAKKTCVGR